MFLYDLFGNKAVKMPEYLLAMASPASIPPTNRN